MADLIAITGLSGQMVDEACGIHTPPPSDRQNLNFIVKHFKIALTIDDQLDRFGQDFIGKTLIVADKTNPDGRQLPQVIIFNLSHGDIEFVFQAGSKRLDYLSFTFQR